MGNVSTNAINETVFAKQLKIIPSEDLVPISMVASIPNLLVSGPNFPPNDLKELIAYTKQRPGQLNFSSPLGGYSHLDMLDFNRQAGMSMVNIPSKGAGSSQTSIISGEIHFFDIKCCDCDRACKEWSNESLRDHFSESSGGVSKSSYFSRKWLSRYWK